MPAIILAGICAVGIVFMVLVLCALHGDRPSDESCRVEQILRHTDIERRPKRVLGVRA